MIYLIVYADILIILNLTVDYFLLLAVNRFLNLAAKFWRIILSAAIGGISSLYIFLPQVSVTAEFVYKLLVCAVMSFFAFGFVNLKRYLKVSGVFFGITCLYGGIMIAIWHIFKPKGMVINNSFVYFNISPVFLISATVCFYFLFVLLMRIFSATSKNADRCQVTLFAEGNTVNVDAIIDTGNSIEDVFGKSEIIIGDQSVYYSLFGNKDKENDIDIKKRYRIIPCATVSGTNALDGYRCDKANINIGNRKITLDKPILAISKQTLDDDYTAILNPKILN